jgi:hypothetical protein
MATALSRVQTSDISYVETAEGRFVSPSTVVEHKRGAKDVLTGYRDRQAKLRPSLKDNALARVDLF